MGSLQKFAGSVEARFKGPDDVAEVIDWSLRNPKN
jgi:hypothetical protein